MTRFTPLAVAALVALVAPTFVVALPHLDPSADPAVMGRWTPTFDGEVPAINMALLNDGRVLYWSGIEAYARDNVFFTSQPFWGESRVLDLSGPTPVVSTPPNKYGDARDLFCSGMTILPDGRILTAGGSNWHDTLTEPDTSFVDGIRDARAFDPATGDWTRVADMADGRWYPTVMTLSDGRALVASGIDRLTDPSTHVHSLEAWTPDAWSKVEGGERLLPLYPRLFVVPSGPMKGDLYYETVGALWGPFGEHPAEALWSLQQAYDPDTNAWRFLGPSAFGARQHASSVMLPLDQGDGFEARIVTFGGSLGRSIVATSASEMTDLSGAEPESVVTAPLNHARWHLNGVLLPDGSVLAVGGGAYDNVYAHGQKVPAVLAAEQFDPDTLTWHERAPMTVERMYHSTAILLPDGRVLAGGHVPLPVPWKDVRENVPDQEQVRETRFEIYEPPYLFWGERPVITSAPADIRYDLTFAVRSPHAADVVDAILVHPGATTHALDSSQRAVVLDVMSRAGDKLTFRAPPDGDVAPPGDWMLFLRTRADERGLVPSVAEFVHLS